MVIIPNGGTTSNEFKIDPNQGNIVIQFPAAMTGTAVALYGCIDGTNFLPIYVDGVQVSAPKVNSSLAVFRAPLAYGITRFKLVSNAIEGAARGIYVTQGKVTAS